MKTWIVTDGAIGNEKQCQALAHYLGVEPEVFRIELRQPWEAAAPYLPVGGLRAIRGPLAQRLRGPLPDLLICAGRRSTLASVTVKRLSSSATFTVQVLDPKLSPRHFDCVVCPEHDQLSGPNVLKMIGAPHIVDEATLEDARRRWAPLEQHPAPRVAVLIGASNRAYEIDAEYLERLLRHARRLAGGGTVLVTASRRTPEALRRRIMEDPGVVSWDGSEGEDNPYLGYLAWADHIVVSADSVNMVSEALGTGRPVYCTPPGSGNEKFRRFHQNLKARGMIRSIEAPPEPAAYQPLRETRGVAQEIGRRIAAHSLESG